MSERQGRFKRVMSRLTSTDEELDAAHMRDRTAEMGCVSVARCGDRQPASVFGTIRTVTLRPLAGVPALEAELFDGTGAITLIWLGRRRIIGIEPGRALTASGRVSTVDGRVQIYNPRYELVPTR